MYRIPQTPDKVWEVLEPIKNNEETVNLLAKKKYERGKGNELVRRKKGEMRKWINA